MKNKNLIILIIGILIAILGAFLVIEISFSPKSFNSLTKPSKDVFLDVDTFNVDEYNEENNEDKEESVEDGIDVETEVDENREYLYEEYEPVLEKDGELKEFQLKMAELTPDEKDIILKGCLINYYRG